MSSRCGAGDGNRTHVYSLEGCRSTIELRPLVGLQRVAVDTAELLYRTLIAPAGHVHRDHRGGSWWGEQDSNLRRRCHQIYSLTPLAAREPPHRGVAPTQADAW